MLIVYVHLLMYSNVLHKRTPRISFPKIRSPPSDLITTLPPRLLRLLIFKVNNKKYPLFFPNTLIYMKTNLKPRPTYFFSCCSLILLTLELIVGSVGPPPPSCFFSNFSKSIHLIKHSFCDFVEPSFPVVI